MALPRRLGPSPALAPDAELVAAIRRGDTAAFEALFRTYYDRLRRFVLSYVRDDAVAEDLVHDVLFRIWERREAWDLTGSVKTYLFTSCRNRAINHLRHLSTRRRLAAEPAASGVPLHAADPGASLDLAEAEEAVRRAIAALPSRCRQTFLLQRQERLSYEEVAEVMGVSLATVKVQMGRALKALRSALTPFLAVLLSLPLR